MGISLSPDRLSKYKDIAMLILKHGRKDLFDKANSPLIPEEDLDEEGKGNPEELAKDLEAMGPTFIKLGQLLSTRADFLPPAYLEALAKLQDNIDPFPFETVEEIVSSELKVRISKAFLEFDREPLAAASLGQVHKAILRNGQRVAVKVQRPDIGKTILEDLNALEDIVTTLEKHTETAKKYSFVDILAEFKKTLINELDYRLEAQNLVRLSGYLKDYEDIIIPQPIEDYCSGKVLTMDYVRGTKITSLSPLTRLDFDGRKLGEDLFKAYLDQVLIHGFFHADPHPGNVFLTDDKRIALIDLGMVARIDPYMREKLLKLLLHISEGRGRDAADVAMELGTITEYFNKEMFVKRVTEFVVKTQDATLQQIQVGRVVVELTRIAADNGIRASSELTMLGKTLLNLDLIGRTLVPDFDPNEIIREHTESITRRHLMKTFSAGNIISSVLELREFVTLLPKRLNTILEGLLDNQFEIKIKAFDDRGLIDNLQKIANRITVGLILAALIIGAALLMRVESSFKILGYPGFAMILFIAAAGIGFILVILILISDRGYKKKNKN
ncbi:MAG TPA: AarF/UbiB family protein [Ignavibacteriaceae bacterium]|nr:AarF/UbiB family protein [Ignavibacteriaceae bacterium]